MKAFLQKTGLVVFWVAWPFWLVYFKLFSHRSRVLIVVDGELLLVKNWLSDSSWGLPGGGAKKGESMEQSAVRELQEELGLHVAPSQLKSLGKFAHKKVGLSFDAYFFLLKLDKKPALSLRRHEISDALWANGAELASLKLNQDTNYVVNRFGAEIL